MKKLILIITIAMLSLNSFSQGIEFFHGTWEEAKAEAKKQNKKIYIDFYTKWCGPCRAIAKEVFPLKSIGDVYNERFINLKIDAEVGEGVMLANKYNVKAYPTFVYANADGSELWNNSVIGYGNEEGMLELADIALGKKVKTWEEFQKEYDAGNREYKFLEEYISARLKATRMPASEKLKLELLKSQPKSEWFKGDNLDMIYWSAKPGSEFYDIMIANKDKFPQLKDKKDVVHSMAMNISMAKWNKNVSEEEIIATYTKDFPETIEQVKEYRNADAFRMDGKNKEYLKAMFAYIEKYGKPKYLSLGSSACAVEKLPASLAKKCLPYLEEGLDLDPPHFYSISCYAYVQYMSGDKKGAKVLAKKYASLTETFADSKKTKWSYDAMKAIAAGLKPMASKK